MTAGALAVRPASGRLYALVAALLAVSVAVQVVRDRGWQPYEPANPLLWVHAGPVAKRLALGFDNLAADVYWMRAVVYYGSKRRGAEATRNYELLSPLLNLVTTLDPHFRVAYRFGAIFLTEAYPSGPGRPDLAVALLRRAIAEDGGAWEYFHDIGFVYYWWLRDYGAAADWFDQASRRPGAPDWLRPLAATTLSRGGDRESARFLWRQLAENTDVDWLKRNAERRLQQLDAMDRIDELNAAMQRFFAREHRGPASWREFTAAERLTGTPNDPAGVPFQIDQSNGRFGVSKQSPLWPLPIDSPTQPPAS